MNAFLDIRHIQIFLILEIFRRAGRTHDVAEFFTALVQRLYLRKMGDGDLPFLDGNDSFENVFEQVATKPKQSLLLTSSSFLVLMLLELCFLLPDPVRDTQIKVIHWRLVLGVFDTGPAGDGRPLHLISWFPPQDWAKRVFDADSEGGNSVAVQPFADHRDAQADEIADGIRRLVSHMREAVMSPFELPTQIPFGALILASLKHEKPLPPELWRRLAFPPEESSARPDAVA